jgi:co-chaperonin GroES (HSP10)
MLQPRNTYIAVKVLPSTYHTQSGIELPEDKETTLIKAEVLAVGPKVRRMDVKAGDCIVITQNAFKCKGGMFSGEEGVIEEMNIVGVLDDPKCRITS